MIGLTHLRYELLRCFRNRRFLLLTLALPTVIYLAVTPGNRHNTTDGVPFPQYFMTGMAAYGAMFAVVSPGSRIAIDRAAGWLRQLRITPMRPATYLVGKVVSAFLVALPTLALLYVIGVAFGVRMGAAAWLEMTGLLLVGLVPFVVLAIALGHLLEMDALSGAVGGLIVVFSLFGGAWGDFFASGVMLTVVKLLPSYWLVHAGRAALGGGGWPAEGWAVVGAWTLGLTVLAVVAYRRDSTRR